MFSYLLLCQLCSLASQNEEKRHKIPWDPFLYTLIPLQVPGTLIWQDVPIWNPFHWNLLEDKVKEPITFQSTSTSKIPNLFIKPKSTTIKFLLHLIWFSSFLGLNSHPSLGNGDIGTDRPWCHRLFHFTAFRERSPLSIDKIWDCPNGRY